MAETSLSKEKIRFLLLEGVHQSSIQALEEAGYSNIEYHKTGLSEDELIQKIGDFHFLGIRSSTHVTKKVLDAAPKLVAIGCFCIGTNQVDLQAAMMKGIPVFNAPFSNTRSVAELVLGEIILLMRCVPWKNHLAHAGVWEKTAEGSFEIRGKKLGIVGYGKIGSQLSILAEALGMDVYYYDIEPKLPLGNATALPSLKSLLKNCQIVSMHVPETLETKNMISEEEIAIMPQHSILINASRGSVVDLAALRDALESGHIRGAAIDVHPEEPKSKDEKFSSPLQKMKNVFLTPHVGGSTVEAQENIGQSVAQKFIQYSDRGSTLGAVNFPQVALSSHKGTHRLLHIHRNIPGIISKINRIFSENNINIAAQYLQTNQEIGYVVIHVDAEYSDIALQKLREIEGTIRTRVLY